jgi:hypothetical protein
MSTVLLVVLKGLVIIFTDRVRADSLNDGIGDGRSALLCLPR